MKVYAPRFNIYLSMFAALALFSGCQTHHSAKKEDKGENEVKLKLDSRRVAVGQKLDMTATAPPLSEAMLWAL